MKQIEYHRQMCEKQMSELAQDSLIRIFNEMPAVSSVQALPIKKIGYVSDFDFDFVLQIDFISRNSTKIIGEVKNNGEIKYIRASIDFLLKALHKNEYGIVVAPYISNAAVKLCEENNIGYYDFSGNCLLKHDNFFMRIEGKPNKYIIKRESHNLLIRSAVKTGIVLRCMLNEPQKRWKVQELAITANVSIGMVSYIKKYLLEKEWCIWDKDSILLNNIPDLIKEWSSQYNKVKNVSFEFYSIDGVAQIEKQLFDLYKKSGTQCILTSFSAAVRYKPTVKYNKAVTYVAQQDFNETVTALNLKAVESGGNVELILPYDDSILLNFKQINDSFVASPVQTILDLYASKARGEEAAEAIIEKEYNTNVR